MWVLELEAEWEMEGGSKCARLHIVTEEGLTWEAQSEWTEVGGWLMVFSGGAGGATLGSG